MKQVPQDARTGALELVDVPTTVMVSWLAIFRKVWSVMSRGTGKMAMDSARKSMLGKVRSQPDLVKQFFGRGPREARQE